MSNSVSHGAVVFDTFTEPSGKEYKVRLADIKSPRVTSVPKSLNQKQAPVAAASLLGRTVTTGGQPKTPTLKEWIISVLEANTLDIDITLATINDLTTLSSEIIRNFKKELKSMFKPKELTVENQEQILVRSLDILQAPSGTNYSGENPIPVNIVKDDTNMDDAVALSLAELLGSFLEREVYTPTLERVMYDTEDGKRPKVTPEAVRQTKKLLLDQKK